ncbi:transcriptional regulator [Lyngbya sp. CCAP 1446/10]|uniref:helix-turn-helix domain-containing transcriptional regulator n=1 Tax=Microcoleaceae TaxID=1892252 RepID=UPI00223867B7|nr:transcriptional regulator [Lyngbya sp. CCAP 1446/10]MCW6049282.1 transcriptional regulator [Lyngbya sp. CCAP 1446/10]
MLKSVNYQDDLMEFLKKPEAAAAYIEAILEEKNVEAELLSLALSNMVEARGGVIHLSDVAKLDYEKLTNLLSKTGGDEVYLLVALLDALGLQLKIGVKSDSSIFKSESDNVVQTSLL